MLYLREWRLYRGFTLKRLEQVTQIDFRILSKYEHGTITHPSTEKLAILADVLGGDLFTPPPVRLADEPRSPVAIEGD